MKKFLLPAVALVALIACNDANTATQVSNNVGIKTAVPLDSNGAVAAAPMDSAAMMQAYTNFAEVGHMQEMLAKSNGSWSDDITVWMAPGAPPMKMMSTSTVSTIMGGRYQQAKHTGTMDGMPFEGIGTTAYDNARKKFINTWIDNFGTGIIYMEGDYDSTAKGIHFVGKQTDPITSKQVDIKQDLSFNNDGTQTMTMYGPPMGGGAEYKMMEIVMKRKK